MILQRCNSENPHKKEEELPPTALFLFFYYRKETMKDEVLACRHLTI